MVEHLPSKHEVLSSNSSFKKKEQKKSCFCELKYFDYTKREYYSFFFFKGKKI
jgi:hypothetical protein